MDPITNGLTRISVASVGGAYRHLPPEERIRRALAAVPSISKSRHAVERGFSRQDQPVLSNLELEPSHSISTSIEVEPTPSISHDNNSRRYNLRSSRPKTFAERTPRYMADRNRFPQFFESYRDSIKLNELPDNEYIPPSHTPTPSSSELSSSIMSSPHSEISSLELFGFHIPFSLILVWLCSRAPHPLHRAGPHNHNVACPWASKEIENPNPCLASSSLLCFGSAETKR